MKGGEPMKAAQGTALRGTAVIRRRGGNHSWHAQLPLYLMFAPFAVLFLLFTVLPVASSIVLSFFSYDMISLPKFSGLSNYIQMFLQDDMFLIGGRVIYQTSCQRFRIPSMAPAS